MQQQTLNKVQNEALNKLLQSDSYLHPYRSDLELRMQNYHRVRELLLSDRHASLSEFANAHHYFGFHSGEKNGQKGLFYREWAPGAKALFLFGDFNDWNRNSHPLLKTSDGSWQIWMSKADKQFPIHAQLLKVHVISDRGAFDRIPLFIRRVIQDATSGDFNAQLWSPATSYVWSDFDFSIPKNFSPLIYEAHIGMAQEMGEIGTYKEFTQNILPRIKEAGYNTLQLMGIMEHPYYGSFGYQVSNFFAASSRFGEPEDLKELVDQAHRLGIAVLIDLVHSHAVKNVHEGINEFDGTDYQFFHAGKRGEHPDWDTKIFDYGKPDVIHFLLSNLKFWLEEYHFDGFRFDGITSMLYHDRGRDPFMNYEQYFNMNVDTEAVTYLQLATELVREIKPRALLIAEDMSGMPGMALPLNQGEGIGFDARLGMGLPDLWIKLLKQRDEDWSMNYLWHELSNRRAGEKTVAYAESHDQALVGDKTIAHWLMDAAIYEHMKVDDHNIVIDRGMALHKMIRFLSISLGGEAYLNFMGNEFGHPEWIDFPTAANHWSHHYARRQWSLADDPGLKYIFLRDFDRDMIAFARENSILSETKPTQLFIDDERKILAFARGSLVFLFNFHPTQSYDGLELPCLESGIYQEVLNTDCQEFGGHERIAREEKYTARPSTLTSFGRAVHIYSPSRTALVLGKIPLTRFRGN